MLGDFNVSPWSVYYKNLEERLSGMNNLTKNFTVLFTWAVKYMPVLQTHIDHIFVNDNMVV
jgi:endonuclease/exonuclease/phosphatase (EEP) superfamily protein YafD